MNVKTLDVSALEPPQPLLTAIQALQELPSGYYLHLFHRMAPCHLYKWLDEHGFASTTRKGNTGCEVFIWHSDDQKAAADARHVAVKLPVWQDF